MLAGLYSVVFAALASRPVGIRVCTSKARKKAGSFDTLDALHALAATSEESAQAASAAGPPATLAAMQAAFGASRVEACGCLGSCGRGPNCATSDGDDVFYDVYKPATAVALLEHIGLTVPAEAQKAWLRRMYAMRALRRNNPAEARALCTEALTTAQGLKGGAAHLLANLLNAGIVPVVSMASS